MSLKLLLNIQMISAVLIYCLTSLRFAWHLQLLQQFTYAETFFCACSRIELSSLPTHLSSPAQHVHIKAQNDSQSGILVFRYLLRF